MAYPTTSLQKGKTSLNEWPCRLGFYNTPTASLERSKTLPTSVLDMALKNMIVSFQ